LSSSLTVGYTTVADSAEPFIDFTPETGSVTFAPGSATATISVPILGSGVDNSQALTFTIQLTTPPLAIGSQQVVDAGSTPFSVAVGDFNGDGLPDLSVANITNNTVSVLTNTTNPEASGSAFANAQAFDVGSYPASVAVGDINGDGKPDLVVTNFAASSVS